MRTNDVSHLRVRAVLRTLHGDTVEAKVLGQERCLLLMNEKYSETLAVRSCSSSKGMVVSRACTPFSPTSSLTKATNGMAFFMNGFTSSISCQMNCVMTQPHFDFLVDLLVVGDASCAVLSLEILEDRGLPTWIRLRNKDRGLVHSGLLLWRLFGFLHPARLEFSLEMRWRQARRQC